MSEPRPEVLPYRRSRFATQLPLDRLYSPAHYWLLEEAPGIWRVGFTKFATRMLGEFVEYSFPITTGAVVAIGDEIGTVEGFKAVTAIYSVTEGVFLGSNGALADNITLLEHDPYRRGWLYRVEGRPDGDTMDARRYVGILDATIDRLLDSRYAGATDGTDDDETDADDES